MRVLFFALDMLVLFLKICYCLYEVRLVHLVFQLCICLYFLLLRFFQVLFSHLVVCPFYLIFVF
nr:MAG TPA: hypothetical protein [Caudoviricetes sp.]